MKITANAFGALVFVLCVLPAHGDACIVNGLQTGLLWRHIDEAHGLEGRSYLSPSSLRDVLDTAKKYYTHWSAAYLLAYADPSNTEAREYLEYLLSMYPKINPMASGGASWALFTQGIRSLPNDDQLDAMLVRLRETEHPWERALLAMAIGRFPKTRETGEQLFEAINREIDPVTTVELGFQLAQYADMDLLERAGPMLSTLRLPIYFMALRCEPKVMLNILTSGVSHSPRRSSAVGLVVANEVYSKLKQHDICPGTSPENIANEAGCSIGQLCPPCGSWKNHGAFVSCVAQAANDFVAAGYIPAWQHGQIVSAAARSDVGKPHYDGAGCAEVDVDAHR